MGNCEFYQYEKEVWVVKDGEQHRIEEGSPIVDEIYTYLKDNYSGAFNALCDYYKASSLNTSYYRFLIVRRFLKCNFSLLDNVMDVDAENHFRFEHVPCPLRGECKLENIVCHPKFDTAISPAEMRVLKLLHEGYSHDEIADKLFLSVYTVQKHIKNVYHRTGIHSERELLKYINDNNLFK